jgi:hypothetical protein
MGLRSGREQNAPSFMKERYENHISPIEIKLQLITLAVVIPFSIILVLYSGKFVAGIVPLFLISIMIFVFIHLDLRQYPSSIEIDNIGVVLSFRIGGQRSFEWYQIADIFLPSFDANKNQYGGFRIKGNSHPYQIEPSIALKIDDAYTRATGTYLQRWDGKKESKVAPAKNL